MDTFWNRSKKKKKEGSQIKKEINNLLIKDRTTRDIRTLFEQEKDYCKPKKVSNFWNSNYVEYESNVIKIETYNYMNIKTKLNLTWGI